MKECVQFAPMIGARPGELGDGEAKALEAHLATCADCRGVARNAEAMDGLVAQALLARASARDFAPFVDQVMARVERTPRRDAGVLGWLHRHRRAAAAALAPALAAVAVIVYVSLGSRPTEVAMLEVSSEGEATTILQTNEGPVVLLSEENGS
ncbi:MAG TPA: zf-HC2 domain-containing protein [Anaeromyxobacter sp.]|nr:zf-HC2 domain-containing protein [Anaeromyxobacter sp.]